MGLNSALSVAGQSLEVFSAGMQVVGQNIANAATPGYIRDELQLVTNYPFQKGVLIFGSGVRAAGIEQQIDVFLEKRIHTATSDFQASSARSDIFLKLEAEIRELGSGDLSTSLNQFLASINEVVNQSESTPLRQIAIEQGSQFAGDVTSLRSRIDELRGALSTDIQALVVEANQLIDRIAQLNPQISKSEAAGLLASDAGALRIQRYNALTRLAEIVPIRFNEHDNGAVDVFIGSNTLILGGEKQHLEAFVGVDRGIQVTNVRLTDTKASIPGSGGLIRGIIDGRDQILGDFVDQLDTYASNLIFEFNRLHTAGKGLKGFESLTAFNRVDDQTVALNVAGLDFTPTHGSFQLKITNQFTGITETTNISIDLDGIGTDTTLEDLRDAINAVANVNASITTTGRLQIDAATGFEFAFADDTSGALAALGINTFFTGSDSGNIAVNSVVANNHAFFAASRGGGPSDGSNAVRLAGFIDGPVDGLSGTSLNDFYDSLITTVAQGSAKESALTEGFGGFLESLNNQREQYSGVSLDEEAIILIEFQHAFQASARLISTIDELFNVLLNI